MRFSTYRTAPWTHEQRPSRGLFVGQRVPNGRQAEESK